MDPRMMDWISTGERPVHPSIISFAKQATGSSKKRRTDDEDDDDEDDEDDDEDDEDDDEDDDDLADLSDDELRAELKKARASLSTSSGSNKKKRDRIKKLNRELEEERNKKSKPAGKKKADDDDDDAPDLDLIRAEARKEGLAIAKKSEAKSALLAAGVAKERVAKAVGLLDLDELDLDNGELDGIDEAIDELKGDWPELFATKRRRRGSVAGEGDRDGDKPRKKTNLSPSERQAAAALGKR